MSVVIGTKFNMKLYITIYRPMDAKFRAFVINTIHAGSYRHAGRPF